MYEILTQVSPTYKALWDVPVRRDDHTQLMFYHLTHTHSQVNSQMVTSVMKPIKLDEERAWDQDKGAGPCEEMMIADGKVRLISYHN